MSSYDPIPKNAIKIALDIWSCGPECCGAVYFYTYCRTDSPYIKRLWESSSLFYEDATKEEIQELREEVIDAANYYGLTLANIDNDCVWDWESKMGELDDRK